MGLYAVGSAPNDLPHHNSLCIREKSDKGGKGRGEVESEEKPVGERGERPVFVGFSNFPPFPEGCLLSPCAKTK